MHAPPPPLLEASDDLETIALLTADNIEVLAGMEVLDTNDDLIEDVSEELLVGGEVEFHLAADVHGTCQLTVARELDWPNVRLAPYYRVTARQLGLTRRFNLGVYIPQTPEVVLGETPHSFDVRGDDKLSLLQPIVGDSYVVSSGTSYLEAVRDVIRDAGAGGRVRLDSSAAGETLTTPMVWALTSAEPDTYLNIANDLLRAVGYESLWVDEDGYFRAGPYIAPADQGPFWTFDLEDPRLNLVSEQRSYKLVTGGPTNWWRFVAKNPETEPTEGSGIYTVDGTGSRTMSFRYHMYGAATGTLQVQVSKDDGRTWTPVWSKSGEQSSSSSTGWWYAASIDLAALGFTGEVGVRFHYVAGPDSTGDTAIDSVVMGSEPLEDFASGLGRFFDGGGKHAWTRQTGGTPSDSTGPAGAHSGSWYVYCEASSPVVEGDTFILEHPPTHFDTGARRSHIEYVDNVANQSALVAHGDRVVDSFKRQSELINIQSSPLPFAGHGNVVAYIDSELGVGRRALVRTWSLPLDGSDMSWELEVIR